MSNETTPGPDEKQTDENLTGGKLTGEELYKRFLAGDSRAFEELVAIYEDDVSRFIYGNVRDFHETQHLTIDTFAQLALNKKTFKGKSTLKTYLFGIAKNLTAQHIRKRKRELHISFEEVAELNIDNGETIYVILEKNERKTVLKEAMRELKQDYNAVLLLLYFEDMSYKQAGQIMNKSERQIKDLAYRAKAALKKKLENSDIFGV